MPQRAGGSQGRKIPTPAAALGSPSLGGSCTNRRAIAHAHHLDVRCCRCERAGRLSVPGLLARWVRTLRCGLRGVCLNAKCPRRCASGGGDAYNFDAPGLAELLDGVEQVHSTLTRRP